MTIGPKETDRRTESVFYSLSSEMREAILQEIYEGQQVEHLYQEAEQRKWKQEIRSTAPQILAVLRQHIPNPQIQEVEDFMSVPFGRECLGDLLNPKPKAEDYPEDPEGEMIAF